MLERSQFPFLDISGTRVKHEDWAGFLVRVAVFASGGAASWSRIMLEPPQGGLSVSRARGAVQDVLITLVQYLTQLQDPTVAEENAP
jgi:hypothetical protein